MEMDNMILYRALCTKEFEQDGIMQFHYWQKGKTYNVLKEDKEQNVYLVKSEYGEGYVSFKDFAMHFQKIQNYVRIQFHAEFETDGDFCFEETNLKELEKSSLYGDAHIDYHFTNDVDCEHISFVLTVEGKGDNCRYVLRDLLEEMMCSIRTHKYWLVKEIYSKLEKFYEAIWNDKTICMYDSMSGNYDGTAMTLIIAEIEPDEIGKLERKNEPKTGWLEIVEQDSSFGDVPRLKCPHCYAVHPDESYVRGFKHCPSCGEVL